MPRGLFTNDLQKAHFFIQLKGCNAGKPLKSRISNSIGILVNEKILFPDYLYDSGKFKQKIIGSVIPYIRQKDIEKVIKSFFIK
ncbi:MAG: hypothetical protein J7J72_00645 [Bacteroidales bacterium]|nr:hypothetical protein [Bacteroidales bacterium]